jgi:mono/diheme cytochrome c family protein
MVDHRTFDPFAFAYLKQLDSLYKVPVAQREQAYDELIQYCAACHGQVCPGPLVRIKKLRMPQPVKPEGT